MQYARTGSNFVVTYFELYTLLAPQSTPEQGEYFSLEWKLISETHHRPWHRESQNETLFSQSVESRFWCRDQRDINQQSIIITGWGAVYLHPGFTPFTFGHFISNALGSGRISHSSGRQRVNDFREGRL